MVAPKLGGPGEELRLKGLSALQAIFATLGIVLIAEWYLIEQPDAARLKFDQDAKGIPLSGGRALVTLEVSITNVGGHGDRFDKLPYKIFVQQVAPLAPSVEAKAVPAPNGAGRVWRADNWETLAYRAVGTDANHDYPNWDACGASGKPPACEDGLETEIQPNETENLYFAAIVPCMTGLHVSVSSRFARPPGVWQALFHEPRQYWIKQSFVDLTDACKSSKGD
ncbi:MAG TPA: hypothetical protein VKU60_07050 [Chloroflexota bacterium]|nr:hypothetical protein [Chloroflexota bacterium]